MKWSFPSQLATILAALIGATVGSLGAVVLKDRLTETQRVEQERQALIREHLFGLQEGAEQLWYRVYNAKKQRDRPDRQDYYELTTLYALGRSLASARILAVKGHYPLIIEQCPDLGAFLREDRLGRTLVERRLRYYDRLALAESLMVEDGAVYRVRSFVEFHQKRAKGELPGRALFSRANGLLEHFKSETDQGMLDTLCELVTLTSRCTEVPSQLSRDVSPSERCAPLD